MIRVSFIDDQHRDIEEPDSLHQDAEFLPFQKGETTLLSANVANVLCIEPAPPETSRQEARHDFSAPQQG
jgi:hypothetical protein